MDAGNARDRGAPPDAVAASAQGWHRIQLAVLGFIGFCGVMWGGGSSSAPDWAQWLAAALVVTAFVAALVAIYLVGAAAYPVPGPDGAPSGVMRDRVARLRLGIRLTYAAVAFVVAATLTAWWPGEADGRAVEVRASGAMWCGALLEGPPETLRLDTADGVVDVPLAAATHVVPVSVC